MSVTNLFVKRHHGAALEPVSTIRHDASGILESVACAPFRQVLITARSVIAECGLQPGDLRENIVVEFNRLHDLPSGTVVKIGRSLIRLTFHCESCRKILKKVDFKTIAHRRGVLGMFLNRGTIAVSDPFIVTEQKMEAIPYATIDRISWFLKKRRAPDAAIDLVHAIGLPAYYRSVVPRMLRRARRNTER
jgi:MOSC domain-containing protein YiiM